MSLPFAEPAAVENLIVTDVTTSSVSLSWAQPGGNVTWYIVRWAGGENTTTETSFVITNLTPGSQYSISVVAVAGVASNEGDGASTVTFTRKFRPTSDLESSQSTFEQHIRLVCRTREAGKHHVDVTRDQPPEHPLVFAEGEVSVL